MPQNLEIYKAKVILLRITVPADIYNSSIIVEVEGVDVAAQVSQTAPAGRSVRHSSPEFRKQDNQAKDQAKSLPSKQTATYDPGGVLSESQSESDEEDAAGHDDVLPTTADLAKSFLEAEPASEKIRLKAAIASQSETVHLLDHSSDEEAEDGLIGTGTGFSLPGFLTNFLKGVSDRLQVTISNVRVHLDVGLLMDATQNNGVMLKPSTVTLQLKIHAISVEAVTTRNVNRQSVHATVEMGGKNPAVQASSAEPVTIHDVRGRPIGLRQIQLSLISDTIFFETFSRASGPPSPSTAQPSVMSDQSNIAFPSKATRSSGPRAEDFELPYSSSNVRILASRPAVPVDALTEDESSSNNVLEASAITNDESKFADADNDDHYQETKSSSSQLKSPPIIKAHSSPSTSLFLYHTALGDDEIPEAADSTEELKPVLTKLRGLKEGHQSPSTEEASKQLSVPIGRDSSGMSNTNKGASSGADQLRTLKSLGKDTVLNSPQTEVVYATAGDFMEADHGKASTHAVEDLSESRLFSHEEAQSMYMSALSRASSKGNTDSTHTSSAGGSDIGQPLSTDEKAQLPSASLQLDTAEKPDVGGLGHISITRDTEEPDQLQSSKEYSSASRRNRITGSNLSTRSIKGDNSPQISLPSTETSGCLSKQLFHVDEVTMILPCPDSHARPNPMQGTDDIQALPEKASSEPRRRQNTGQSSLPDIPGAFNSDSVQHLKTEKAEILTSQATRPRKHREPPFGIHEPDATVLRKQTADQESRNVIEVTLGDCLIQLDLTVGRLVFMLAQGLKATLDSDGQSKGTTQVTGRTPSTSGLSLRVKEISTEILDDLRGIGLNSTSSRLGSPAMSGYKPSDAEVLLRSTIGSLEIDQAFRESLTETRISAGKLSFGYAKDDILAFDAGLKIRSSTRDVLASSNEDISVTIRHSPSSCKVNVTTLPMHIELDLQRLDEALSWVGGFSSILGLGNSITSLATVAGPNTVSAASQSTKRGVHFEPGQEPDPALDAPLTEDKIDIRVGGVVVDLHGKDCTVRLDTTAVKVVSRPEGIGAQVDKMKLSGPYSREDSGEVSAVINIENTRIEYLSSPKETDLGRLLSLLSPSNNNYNRDDDILIETLLRQRKQGPVLRVTLEKLTGQVGSVQHLSRLSGLSEEIGKLSTVTKYLPEDDRAGILTLGLVHTIAVEVTTGTSLGILSMDSRNMEIGHVSIPSLLAMSIGSFYVRRDTEEELLGAVADVSSSTSQDTIPMMMARMIGEELEPTVKLKLTNVQVEYRVPVIAALTEILNSSTSREDAESLTESGTGPGPHDVNKHRASANNKSVMIARHLGVDISLRNCGIGLNPLALPCKALLLLTDTHLTTRLSEKDLLQATLEIRKSTLLLVDDVNRLHSEVSEPPQLDRKYRGGDGNLESGLCAKGFVSVGYISAAEFDLQQRELASNGNKSIDVGLKNNLLVLESCADSTQTLLSLLNGLKLPTVPNKDVRYRTEVVPVEDLLASLSGDAFGPVEQGGDDDDLPHFLEESFVYQIPHDDDILSMSSQEPDEDFGPENLDNLPISAGEGQGVGDFLGRPISTDEHLQFEEDHFDSKRATPTNAHKWDSIKNAYGKADASTILGSPMTVRVQDVHIIWNLFDGYDWPKTRDAIGQAVQEVMDKAAERRARTEQRQGFTSEDDEEESVIGDFLFNSIYIGIPANRDPKDLSKHINKNMDDLISEADTATMSNVSPSHSGQARTLQGRGKKLRLGRSKYHKMTFELKGVSLDLVMFPPDSGETQSSIDVRVRDFEIFDHVPTSTWRKFATYMLDAGVRETGTSMLHLEILNVKPIPELAASEIVLKARKTVQICWVHN